LPLLTIVFFFSYLDRVNISFAALTMNQALGFSNTVFGRAAGAYAIGYALFAIPSTLLLHRLGARRWISFIMIAWASCSAATAFVRTPQQLMAVRLLLGVAEAGFIPGVIFYFGYWFPSEFRGRALSSFYSIGPLALLIGGPASSAVLSLDGHLAMAGWEWLFIIEALPTVLLAVLVYFVLPDHPAQARWLSVEERQAIDARLSIERLEVERLHTGASPWRTLLRPPVLALAAVYLGIGTSGIGAVFFLPLMIRSMGFSVWNTGLIAALPGMAATVALPFWGWWTDRSRKRAAVVATGCGAIAGGLACTAALLPSPWALIPLSIGMIGFYGCLAAFWALPSAFLTGAAAAAGIGFINLAGNIGNFTGPYLLGWISDATHSYGMGLACLAAIAAIAAGVLVTPSSAVGIASSRRITVAASATAEERLR
jgi:ACS family tartrate transporter-like MFS transporter